MECQNCTFAPIVQAISTILALQTVVIERKNVQLNAIEFMIHRHKKTNPKLAKVANALAPSFKRLRAFVEAEMLPICQNVCLTCAKNSDDDNLSRGGQTYVFMEAMPGASGELAGGGGRANAEGDAEGGEGEASDPDAERDMAFFDDNGEESPESETRGNWLNSHAIVPIKSGSACDSVTRLPTGVENELRGVLAAFKDLTILQQCILLLRWQEMSFVDIGSMTWVPEEFRRHNDKQLVSFWWRQIVKKFPMADALSAKKNKKGSEKKSGADEEDDYKSHSPKVIYCEQELDFGVTL